MVFYFSTLLFQEGVLRVKKLIELQVNGVNYELLVNPARPLVDVLREELGLTGVKKGCGMGECGACTVLLNGKAVNSCLMLVGQAHGKEITTIEGLSAGGRLHPLQEKFIQHGAVQCGFCSPGMVLSILSFLRETPHPTEEQVREAIAGNLCRCTGYVKIVEAVMDYSQAAVGGQV